MNRHRTSFPAILYALRRWHTVVETIVVCLLCCGCPEADHPDETPSASLPYSGVQLKLALPASLELSDQWAPAINDWAGENEARVEIIEVDFSGDPSTWLPQFQESPTTLAVMPTTHLGELSGANLAATIPPEMIESDVIGWHQVPPSVRSTLGVLSDEPAFITVDCPTPAVAIRADLLEAAGLEPPKTWSEYDQLVTDVDEWAPNLSAVEPRADEFLPTLFLARAVSAACHPAGLSVELDVSDATPLIDSAPYAKALTELQAISPHLAEEVRSMTPADCLNALCEGRAAIGILWESAAASLSTGGKSVAAGGGAEAGERGTLSFIPLPGRQEVYNRDESAWEPPPDADLHRPNLCGFAGFSVAVTKNDDERSQSAAWDLWALLVAYQTEGMVPTLAAGSPTTNQLFRAATLPGLGPEENAQYRQLQSAEQHNRWLVCELPMAGRGQLRTTLGAAIARALDENQTASAALQEAGQQWSEVIDEVGRTKVLNSDRSRLGLVPVAD